MAILDVGQVQRGLVHLRRIGPDLIWAAEATSTNDLAKASSAPAGTIWFAEHQTAGRGRSGRSWQSAPEQNLMFSVLVELRAPSDQIPGFALAVGASVAASLDRFATGAKTRIKWPNDLYLAEKKVGGVLLESRGERVVVGIGVNVNQRAFGDVVSPTPISIAEVRGETVSREALFVDILSGLDQAVGHFEATGLSTFLPSLQERDLLLGEPLEVEEVPVGHGAGIDESGRLRVRTSDGLEQRLVSGDVRRIRVHTGASAVFHGGDGARAVRMRP